MSRRALANLTLPLIAAFASLGASPSPGPAPTLPAACAILTPEAVSRALGRTVDALSAALLGENEAARNAHLVNCVYSYDRAPYPVALTANLTKATRFDLLMLAPGQRRIAGPWNFAVFQADNRGGGLLTVYSKQFDLALWTPDFADRAVLAALARSALGAPTAPKRPAPAPKRATRDRYACEILAPNDATRVLGEALNASAPSPDLCQYAAMKPPYRVAATLTIESKPPGTAFDLQRIGDYQLNRGTSIQAVPLLPFGHFVRPARAGAAIFFDLGTTLVTVATPDRADRSLLERLASSVRDSLGASH